MDLQRRLYLMGKGLFALGIWMLIASIWAVVTNISAVLDGEPWGITRVVIGLIGIAATGYLFSGHNHGRTGWLATMTWSVLQLPYFSGIDQENYTRQLIDGLLGASSSTTVNGELTSAEAYGINLVGLVLVIITYALRSRVDLWRRRAEP